MADLFAGSGTAAAAALEHGCSFLMVDNSLEAFQTQQRRFSAEPGISYVMLDQAHLASDTGMDTTLPQTMRLF